MMCCVTKTISIHFVSGKCHRKGKALNIFNQSHRVYITLLVLIPLRVDTHTHIRTLMFLTKVISNKLTVHYLKTRRLLVKLR